MLIKEVEKTLQRYDNKLRIRFSKQYKRWAVERKVRNGTFNLARPYHYESDRYYQVRDGYIQVGFFPPYTELTWGQVEGILRNLSLGDVWAHGGADKLSDEIDEEYARESAQIDKDISNENLDLADDAYENRAWVEKRRVNVPIQIT